jgi:hypothetical protein
MRDPSRWLICFAAVLTLAACGIDVREQEARGAKAVDIRTPVGELSVRTDVDVPATGLPLYPGARPLREAHDTSSANVDIGLPFVNLKVVAAKFEHTDAPEAILAFYRDAMRTHGEVVECKGEIDFKSRSGRSRPVCDERRSSREIQLAAGTEERHRLVVVKPRGEGSEFAVVYVQADAEG